MGSLSGLYDLSRSALIADQVALNATSNNVANQNTVGYTRQVASFQAGDTVTLTSSGQIATSGPAVNLTSQRDRVLEQRLQQAVQQQSSTGARSAVLAQIGDVYDISGTTDPGSTQLGTDMNSLFSAFSALAADPSAASGQQSVLNAAQALASDFNSAASQLASISSGLNSSIASSVSAVNGLTASIASLNAQIAQTSPGADAGTLEDQRQAAIAQLSQYLGLDQISTENNGLTLTTQGGAVLVAGAQSFALSASAAGGVTSIQDPSGASITGTISCGSIGGQLQSQSTDIPNAQSALDSLAFALGSAINTQNAAGFTSAGFPGAPVFSLPPSASGAAAAISVSASGGSPIAPAAVGEGSTGGSNATALAALATSASTGGRSLTDQLAAMLGSIGSTASTLGEDNTVQQASVSQLTTQRDSLSAVSLDTEAANLTQYEKSYEAAAKVLTTLDSLMADAINIGTPTTVS